MIHTLLYHDIAPDEPARLKRVNPLYTTLESDLLWQLDFLSDRGFQFVDIRDWVAGNLEEPKNSAFVTFDGCFHSWLRVAELLKQRRIPATFYVVSSWLNDHQNQHPYQGEASLSSKDLLSLHEMGFCIGSHSVSHYPFHPKADESEQDFLKRVEFECTQSKLDLESCLGIPVEHFATPNGIYSAELDSILRSAGYLSNRNVKKKADLSSMENPMDLGIFFCDTARVDRLDFQKTFGESPNPIQYFLLRLKRRFLRKKLQQRYKRKIKFEWEK